LIDPLPSELRSDDLPQNSTTRNFRGGRARAILLESLQSKLVNKFADIRPIRSIIGWVFAYMSFAIPVKRLRETGNWMAFHHPKPVYRLHILIVPKRTYTSFLSMPADDSILWKEFIEIVQSLVQELELEKVGYRLIANGGPNQDFPHAHFHLVSGEFPKGDPG
jgi:histidine triad (HIT) family protein